MFFLFCLILLTNIIKRVSIRMFIKLITFSIRPYPRRYIMNSMAYKDSILRAKQFSAVDVKTGRTLWISRTRSPQHLYPLTEKDYCEAIKYAVQYGIEEMPILSVSAKDFPYCDFDCLLLYFFQHCISSNF